MNCPYIDCVYGRTEIFLGVGIAIAFGIESYAVAENPDSNYGNEHDNDNRYADNDNGRTADDDRLDSLAGAVVFSHNLSCGTGKQGCFQPR